MVNLTMAFEISEKEINEYNKDEYKFLRFRLRNWRNIQRFRKIIRICKTPVYKTKKDISYGNFLNKNRNDYESISKFYEKNSFCFIEKVFDEKFHNDLLNNLPGKEFFKPPRLMTKQYNFGFKWVVDDPGFHKVNFYHFNELRYLNDQLKKPEFFNWLKQFLYRNLNHELKQYSFISTIAEENSILFCHKDSIANLDEDTTLLKKDSSINLIFFIKGIDNEPNCGGTGIYETNDFTKPIFVPKILNNSLLIYKSDANLFHGFQKMRKNSFRFTVNSEFASY